MRHYLFFFSFLIIILIACNKNTSTEIATPEPEVPATPTIDTTPPAETSPIPMSPQRSGDKDKGWAYLITGDYVNSGLLPIFYSISAPAFIFSAFSATSNASKIPSISPSTILSKL